MIWNKTEVINYLIQQGKDNIKYKLVEYREKRSLSQNSYLHCIFSFVAEYWWTWYTAEQIKDVFKQKFLSEYDAKFDCYVTKRTRDLNTKEMTDFIENIRVFCSEFLQLEIPNADEKRLLEFYNEQFF